jgi:hypothetical protein
MPFRQGLVHGDDDLLIGQHGVGERHPGFAEVAHFLGNEPNAEAELRSSHLNRAASS